MKRISSLFIQLFVAFCFLSVFSSAEAQRVFDLNVWKGRAPHAVSASKDTAKIRVFLPDPQNATGRSVVICPGGGYEHLALKHEGTDWAYFFNEQGIAVIVLKYRMPHGNREIPYSDLAETMRLVKANAKAWHIKKNDIGVMGFSAGGHLASTIATRGSADIRPDFQILFYPVITMMSGFAHVGSHDNLLGKHPGKKLEKEYSTDRQVSRVTPHAFISLSDDDDVVSPANGVNYYMQLFNHDVPATLHVYSKGGHGFGYNKTFQFHKEMLSDLKAWLKSF